MIRPRTLALALLGIAVLTLLGSLVLGMRGDGASAAVEPVGDGEASRIRVEVLNASGVPGLARVATDRLRDAGYDVVYFGNGRTFSPESSLVLDRAGTDAAAREVAGALEIPRVLSRPDTTLYLEVTVVLGKDWVGAPPPPAPDSAGADSAAGGS